MPAPRPAYNTPLDSSNPLNASMEFLTWFGENPSDPDVLTDVSGNGNHGAISGLEPGGTIVVTGGTGDNAAYNQTYAESGTWGMFDPKPKYVSADGLYWCVYDDEFMMCWVLMPANGWPDMDAVATDNGAVNPWSGTWDNSFSVAQGDLQPGPWQEDGLVFNGTGGVTIAHDADISIPGTLTFGFVITRTSNPAGWESYFSKRTDSLTPRSNFFTNHSGTTFQFGYGGFTIGSFTCSAGNWPGTHRFVCVLQQSGSNTAVTAYWDDVSVYSGTLSGNVAENTSPLYIGRNETGEQAKCTMSVAFLASRAWSADDVADWGADIYALAEQSGSTAVSAVAASSFAAGLAVSGAAPTAHAAGLAVSADAPTSFAAGVDAGSTAVSAQAPTSFAAGLDVTAEAPTSLAALAAVTGAAGTSFAAGQAVSAQAPTSYAVTPAYVYWTDDLPGASYGKLCIAEEDVQVVDDFGAVADQGWQLSVCDGALRYTAWFREDGCNLHGLEDVTFDFTDRKHRVRLECQSGRVRLLVDGMLLQTGGAAGPTTRTVLAWGSWIPDDF